MTVEDPVPNDSIVRENLESYRMEAAMIGEKFEEIWKQLRQRSFREVGKRAKRPVELEVGDLVYVWIPKLLQEKHGTRWSGPYKIEERLTISGTKFLVNGKEEHAFNLKKALT